MTQANHALRLRASLQAEAERLAMAEGTALNQLINVAVAEKIPTLRSSDFFRERTWRVPDADVVMPDATPAHPLQASVDMAALAPRGGAGVSLAGAGGVEAKTIEQVRVF
jgi:hypothetical protein